MNKAQTQKNQNQTQDYSQYFEYGYEEGGHGGGGSKLDLSNFKKLAEIVSEGLKRMPKDMNCIRMTLRQWNSITGQRRNSCSGLLDKANSYHDYFKELEKQYGFHAIPDKARKIVKFFPVGSNCLLA